MSSSGEPPTPSVEDRKSLGAFLASRRARLQPGEVGLPAGQRRTPGLRREEVAVLAGISVSWYTWLEQGRDIGASAATLRRLADVLRLGRAEAEHLLALAARGAAVVGVDRRPSDALVELVQAVDPVPAYVRNDRLDILSWNPAVADLFVDYGALAPAERNTLRLMFLHTPYRSLIHDWERVARATVGLFRAARDKASDRMRFDALVEEIGDGSAEFRRWWPEADVEGFYEGVKRIDHPVRGPLDLGYVAMTPDGRLDLSFVTYLPRPAACDRRS